MYTLLGFRWILVVKLDKTGQSDFQKFEILNFGARELEMSLSYAKLHEDSKNV